MNHETVALFEKFLEITGNEEKALQLLIECRDSGLRWYDGENDKWKDIE